MRGFSTRFGVAAFVTVGAAAAWVCTFYGPLLTLAIFSGAAAVAWRPTTPRTP